MPRHNTNIQLTPQKNSIYIHPSPSFVTGGGEAGAGSIKKNIKERQTDKEDRYLAVCELVQSLVDILVVLGPYQAVDVAEVRAASQQLFYQHLAHKSSCPGHKNILPSIEFWHSQLSTKNGFHLCAFCSGVGWT